MRKHQNHLFKLGLALILTQACMACAGHSKDSLEQAKALLAKGDQSGAQSLLVSAINNSSKNKEQLALMKQLADLRANDPPASQEKLLGQISTLSMELYGAKSLEYADACARLGKNKFALRDFCKSNGSLMIQLIWLRDNQH